MGCDFFSLLFTNLHSVGDVISAHGGEGGVVLLRVVVVVVVVVLAERIRHGAAQAVVAQEAHQRVAFAGRDAVAGQGGGGAGRVGGGAQAELQGGGERAQGQLAGGGAAARLQAGGGGAQGRVAAAAVAVRRRLAGDGGAGGRVSDQTRLNGLGTLTGAWSQGGGVRHRTREIRLFHSTFTGD